MPCKPRIVGGVCSGDSDFALGITENGKMCCRDGADLLAVLFFCGMCCMQQNESVFLSFFSEILRR